jgi:hypothetical protein
LGVNSGSTGEVMPFLIFGLLEGTVIITPFLYLNSQFYLRSGYAMVKKKFKLFACINSDNPPAIKPVLERIIGNKGIIKPTSEGFKVNVELDGESARALNRILLSEMHKVSKKTRIRAEWTQGKTIEKFFDYVPKGTRKVPLT